MKVGDKRRKFECREDIHYKTQTGTSCEKCNAKAFRLGIEPAPSGLLDQCSTTELQKPYMFLITCICGIFIAVTTLSVIQCFIHRKLKNRSNSARISLVEKNPKRNPKGVDDRTSVYDELELKSMNLPDNHYQSLRENWSPAPNTEAKTDEQSFYQDLGENRENLWIRSPQSNFSSSFNKWHRTLILILHY